MKFNKIQKKSTLKEAFLNESPSLADKASEIIDEVSVSLEAEKSEQEIKSKMNVEEVEYEGDIEQALNDT
jgi:hypothetical protein